VILLPVFPDLTPLEFSCAFAKDAVCVPPLPTTLLEFAVRLRFVAATFIPIMLLNV
jgi:hypothetical protein